MKDPSSTCSAIDGGNLPPPSSHETTLVFAQTRGGAPWGAERSLSGYRWALLAGHRREPGVWGWRETSGSIRWGAFRGEPDAVFGTLIPATVHIFRKGTYKPRSDRGRSQVI